MTMLSLEEMKRDYCLYVFKECGWNRTQAAKILLVDYKSLGTWLKKWGYRTVTEKKIVEV